MPILGAGSGMGERKWRGRDARKKTIRRRKRMLVVIRSKKGLILFFEWNCFKSVNGSIVASRNRRKE